MAEIGPNRCVYVEAVPGIPAVRIGRTVDLLQRLRRFEYTYFPIEVVLYGECSAWEFAPVEAERELFSLLDPIHLWRHNRDLYTKLPTYDWFLPDRRKILEAFFRLCRGRLPLLTRIYRMPLFDRVTRIYPSVGQERRNPPMRIVPESYDGSTLNSAIDEQLVAHGKTLDDAIEEINRFRRSDENNGALSPGGLQSGPLNLEPKRYA